MRIELNLNVSNSSLLTKIKNTRGENRVLLKGENMKKTL